MQSWRRRAPARPSTVARPPPAPTRSPSAAPSTPSSVREPASPGRRPTARACVVLDKRDGRRRFLGHGSRGGRLDELDGLRRRRRPGDCRRHQSGRLLGGGIRAERRHGRERDRRLRSPERLRLGRLRDHTLRVRRVRVQLGRLRRAGRLVERNRALRQQHAAASASTATPPATTPSKARLAAA